MRQDELIDAWIRHHNKHYNKYCYESKEPRWHTKQFFLYSYKLLERLNKDNSWAEYLSKYSEIFRRDPADDYYGYRDPSDSDPEKARRNSLEWANIFELNALIGFPYNESAKEKMLKRSERFLSNALKSLPDCHHDILICSAIEFMPETYGSLSEAFFKWLDKYSSNNEVTPHQIIAYLSTLKNFDEYKYLKTRLIEKFLFWIKNPEENSRRQILIWARLVTRLEWCLELSNKDTQELLKSNFLKCLKELPGPNQLDWYNIPIIIDALYKLSEADIKRKINDKIASEIPPSMFYKLKNIFHFLDEDNALIELQNEVSGIKEKCKPAPSRELCWTCMNKQQGVCWIRILSKITGVAPWSHSGSEVADVVVYTLQQGIYFVIKSNSITSQRGEGDILYRQCTQLFNGDHALVLYWNPSDTHPSVIETIRKNASSIRTNPRFEVVDKKYIRQVYSYYMQNFGNEKEEAERKTQRSLFDF
jgi:hypothetical protein